MDRAAVARSPGRFRCTAYWGLQLPRIEVVARECLVEYIARSRSSRIVRPRATHHEIHLSNECAECRHTPPKSPPDRGGFRAEADLSTRRLERAGSRCNARTGGDCPHRAS